MHTKGLVVIPFLLLTACGGGAPSRTLVMYGVTLTTTIRPSVAILAERRERR